ncbi:MAG: secretin N-terminal domain-containing protein [Opitutales bacterium]
MKKYLLPFVFLSSCSLFCLHLAAQNEAIDEINLSDVIVIEDIEPVATESARVESAAADVLVVEIADDEIENVRLDLAEPLIPEVTQVLPGETEAVLEIPGQEAQTLGEATKASEETISVDFPDEDVRTILRNVADLFELNLVIPDTLQGRTSIKLRNVSWGQVFEVVLDPLGFTYLEDRNIIRIKSIDELTTEPVDTRVFIVNFARAADLQASIGPLLDAAAGGQIRVDARSNALVITERPSRMNKIQEIIDRLDKPNQQVMIESKFVEVQTTDIKNIGVNWISLNAYDISAGPFQRQWERNRESGQNSSSSSGRTSSTTTDTTSGAINGDPNAVPEVVSQQANIASSFQALSDVASSASTGRFDTAVFSADEFSIILSALKTQNDVKLVANPTVVTMDNKKATIDIAEFFPNPQFSFNAQTGQRQLDGVDIDEDGIRVGILLDVTPQVNAAGFINLEIEPTVSRSDRTVVIEGSEFPIIDKRTTKTSVMIKDGFTLAIGGLTENSESKGSTKVPLLGDLPGVGRLFKSESNEIAQRNLIIFITAKTLNPDGSTYRDVIDPRVLEEMRITRTELPGYDLPIEERELLRRLEDERVKTLNEGRLRRAKETLDALDAAKLREAEAAATGQEKTERNPRFRPRR